MIAPPFSLSAAAARNILRSVDWERESPESRRVRLRAAADRESILADDDSEPPFYCRGAELDDALADGSRSTRTWMLAGERNAGLIAGPGERYVPRYLRK